MGNIFSNTKFGFPSKKKELTMDRKKRSRTGSLGCVQDYNAQVFKRRDSRPSPTLPAQNGEGSRDPLPLDKISEEGFIINGRYRVEEKLGSGSFGIVLKVRDLTRHHVLALKVNKREKYAVETRKEGNMLYWLNQQDICDKFHIVRLFTSFAWEDKYFLGVELLSINVWQYLYQHDHSEGLDLQSIQTIIYQLVEALGFLASRNVVHSDIKPNNVMIANVETLQIKLIDFGSAERDYKVALGTCFQTLFYRAPEVMLGLKITTAIDMWSVGCMMAELYIKDTLFEGDSEPDQVNKIIEVLGMPPAYILSRGIFAETYFAKVNLVGHNTSFVRLHIPGKDYEVPGSKKLADILKKKPKAENLQANDGDDLFEKLLVNIVMKMLEYDPAKRIFPSTAREHSFFRYKPKKIQRK